MKVTIQINGEKKEVAANTNLTEMLRKFSMPAERVAVELNNEVVRRKDWETKEISDGDIIEVIHFVGGG